MSDGKPLEICVVEDEPDLREEVVEYLCESGFSARGFPASRELYASLLVRPCDIVVLDIGLPGEDGFVVAERLHEIGSMGIVMMTARGQTEDRVRGLLRGADVYLVKPVDLLELRAVLVSLARRLGRCDGGGPPSALSPVSWSVSPDGWTFSDGTGSILLTAQERLFLQCLAASPGEAVSRERLVVAIGGDPYDYDYHGLESLVSRLRRKAVEQGVVLPLRTVRGAGYLI